MGSWAHARLFLRILTPNMHLIIIPKPTNRRIFMCYKRVPLKIDNIIVKFKTILLKLLIMDLVDKSKLSVQYRT